MSTRTRFEEEAKGNSEMAYYKRSCGFDSKQIAVFYCSILTMQIKHMGAVITIKQTKATFGQKSNGNMLA